MTESEEKEMEEVLTNTLSYRLRELENAIEDLKKCVGDIVRNTKLFKRLFKMEAIK